MADTDKTDLTQLTVQLLSAYLANNIIAREDLADLITTTRLALSNETAPTPLAEPAYLPAVTVRKSLASPEHILSLIDGKPYKMLKRHLAQHGLTPDQYRERYGLPRDYPMTSKNYSEQRRATAARIGLGSRKNGRPVSPASAAPSNGKPADRNAKPVAETREQPSSAPGGTMAKKAEVTSTSASKSVSTKATRKAPATKPVATADTPPAAAPEPVGAAKKSVARAKPASKRETQKAKEGRSSPSEQKSKAIPPVAAAAEPAKVMPKGNGSKPTARIRRTLKIKTPN